MTDNQAVTGSAAAGTGPGGASAPTAATGTGGGAAADGPLRHRAAACYRWLLLVFVVAGAAQIFLAGLGVFHHHSVGLGPHETLGFIMGGIAVLILVLALLARPGRQAIAWVVVLVVQTDFLQSLLAGLGDDAAVWGGLHALDGLLAIAIACYLYGSALARRRGDRARVRI